MDASSRRTFRVRSLQRVMIVMTLTFTPVTSVTLRALQCIRVEGRLVLESDVTCDCRDGSFKPYRRAAAALAAVYLVCVPLCFL